MVSVLFVCTGNQYRSPIAAEAFREQLVRDGRAAQWQVNSAGTWTSPGRHAPRTAVELARLFGVNIDEHVTRLLDAKMLKDADLVFVMEEGHKEAIQAEFPFAKKKLHLLSQVADELAYDIPDPAASTYGEAREIVRELVMMIRMRCGNIYKIAESI